ncbi:envelope glycoprotein gp95-like [Patagioenas fasciata monilis]|uniref:Envelope glycoprotein gp95-like n=1 Tax=Patagioenas fasciata monilis TaxID=372326 RepID=A0A1V4J3P0_PATFA|nr:envelope glycoprotein gp95-like [Patagioenas fasciata monilis]
MVASTKSETCVIFLTMIDAAAAFWMPTQTKTNMWITLANMTDQDSICLAMSSLENPFHTRLVGILLDDYSSITQLFQNSGWCKGIATNCNNANMALWIICLPEADIEPQELELLASMPMDACIQLVCEKCQNNIQEHKWIKLQNVNATLGDYRNETQWCNASQKNPRGVIDNVGQQPQNLLYGVFLICGDRAWPGIPSNAVEGPCILG